MATDEAALKAVEKAIQQTGTGKQSPSDIAALLDEVSTLLDELRRRLTLIQRTLGTNL